MPAGPPFSFSQAHLPHPHYKIAKFGAKNPMRTILLFLMLPFCAMSQEGQRIRGRVLDKETQQTLPGVNIALLKDSTILQGTSTDVDGRYVLSGISPGRYTLRFTFIGYSPALFNNLEVKSGKEFILDAQLEESAIEMKAVEITASQRGEAGNEMALISSRQFTVSETERYAGSRGEPSRMASNFAGVQGADDSRNDIVIRGNSPQAILWRLEDINIYNPNHFNIPGTAGGSVSILNNKTLANSDFYTGAFPAEFGNATAGVFDLSLRPGNNQQHEFTGQFGFLGVEAMAEGPINKANYSSYLVSYRYSSLSLFSSLGIDIGTNAVPKYQDATFHLNFPGKKGGAFSIFGLGGWSDIDILISDQKEPDRNIYGDNDRDQYFGSTMAVFGMAHLRPISEKTYWKNTLAYNFSRVDSYHELVFRHLDKEQQYEVDSLKPLLDYTFLEQKLAFHSYINSKLSRKHVFKAGVIADLIFYDMVDSTYVVDSNATDFLQWRLRYDATDQAALIEPYAQWKFRPNEKWSLSLGLHAQYFTLNETYSLPEPRLAVQRHFPGRQSITFGAGVHSQLQPSYLYFYAPEKNASGDLVQINRGMGMTKALHAVMGYDKFLAKNLRFKSEVYYQWLYDIPVENSTSSFSLANTGSGFDRFFPDTLVNNGLQRNYGIEFTLEKYFGNTYYFLVTLSLFESEYMGSDGVWRNTDFNGNYAANALFAKDFKISAKSRLSTGAKVTTVGGRWYGPADIAKSNQLKQLVVIDSLRNTRQFPAYFRLDLKLNYRINRAKVTHEIGIDLVNVLDTKNVLSLTYAPDENNDPNESIRREYQLGRLPLFYYRIEF